MQSASRRRRLAQPAAAYRNGDGCHQEVHHLETRTAIKGVFRPFLNTRETHRISRCSTPSCFALPLAPACRLRGQRVRCACSSSVVVGMVAPRHRACDGLGPRTHGQCGRAQGRSETHVRVEEERPPRDREVNVGVHGKRGLEPALANKTPGSHRVTDNINLHRLPARAGEAGGGSGHGDAKKRAGAAILRASLATSRGGESYPPARAGGCPARARRRRRYIKNL